MAKHAWIIGACAYVLVVLSVELARFPGLHGDEAWFGLEALRIGSRGLTSAHGMTPYTGTLFPWLLAEVFRVLPPGVFALRLPGVVLNAAALAVLLVSVERIAGRRRAVLLFLLLGSSLLFLWMSRVAWEVTALQLILLATMIAAVLDAGVRERWTATGIVVFLIAGELGIVNHVIFSSVPASFLAAAVLTSAGRKSKQATEHVWVGVLAVFSMTLAFLVKWALPDPVFARWSALLLILLLAWPLAVARWARTWPARLDALLERAGPRLLLTLLLLGVAAFAIQHGGSFIGAVANVLPMKRFASWDPPLAGTLLGHAWALAVMGALAVGAREAVRRVRWGEALRTPDLMTLWALACAVALTLLTGRHTLRYYVPLSVLISVAVALSLPERRAVVRPFAVATALAFVTVNVIAWRAVLEETTRPPISFMVGDENEVSNHFLDLDPLVQDLEARGICRVEADYFIAEPLSFYRATRPRACSTDQVYWLRYCDDCPPPYILVDPVELP